MQTSFRNSRRSWVQRPVTVVLLCLFGGALAMSAAYAQEAPAAGDVTAERTRFIDKVKEINRWGPQHRIVGDVTAALDKCIAEGADLVVHMGPGLTKDHQPYRLTWTKKKLAFAKLTGDEAAKAGVQEMTMAVQQHSETTTPGPRQPPPAAKAPTLGTPAPLAHEYMVSDVELGNPPGVIRHGQPFPVKARIRRSSDSKPGDQVFLKVTHLVVLAAEEFVPPQPGGETVVRFTASPNSSVWHDEEPFSGIAEWKLDVYVVHFFYGEAGRRVIGEDEISNRLQVSVRLVRP